MKKAYKYLLPIMMSAAVMTGCSDFLKTQSLSDMTHGNYYSSVEDLEGALHTCYSKLGNGHNLGTYGKGLQILGELGTDECFTEGKNELNSIPIDIYSTLNSANVILSKFWINAYEAINRSNEVIKAAEILRPTIEKNGEAPDRLDGIVAEAEFLESLWYFNLVRNFGGVPLMTEPSTSSMDFVSIQRDSLSTVYKHIISSLEDAYDKLQPEEFQGQIGRCDKYAASALLSKVYLHIASSMTYLQPRLTEEMKLDGINSYEWTVTDEGGNELSFEQTRKYYYQKAAEYAKITIDYYGGKDCLKEGTLVGKFYPVESTRDVLFEVIFSQNLTPNQGNYFGFLFGPDGKLEHGGGHNVIAPTMPVILENLPADYDTETKTWSSDDDRFLWSISTYRYDRKTSKKIILNGSNLNSTIHLYRINKFHTNLEDLPPHSIGVGVNCPILRLSDICLIYSEALAELSWMDNATIDPLALEFLNAVRSNANAEEYTMDDVRTAIEFKMSNGSINDFLRGNKEIKGYENNNDMDHFRRTILNERMIELLGEGHRWYDLTRLGILPEVVTASCEYARTYQKQIKDKAPKLFNVFRPLPLRELQVQQGNLKQNNGYY